MKKFAALSVCLGVVVTTATTRAIDFKQSKITEVVNDVQIISAAKQQELVAKVNDIFSMPDVLRTGASSRAELVAQDQTVTRVGANTIFSFDPADRTIDLKQGSLLFHAPHGKGGGAIHTGSATASVLGTTLIVTTTPNGGFKVIALEGQVEVKFLNGLKQKLDPGQMTFVLPGANQLAPVIIFRLDEQVNHSLLVKGFNVPLDSLPLIQNQIDKQLGLLHSGKLTQTPYYAGNNATADQVYVLDINTIAQNTRTLRTADATLNQSSLTAPEVPTPPNHVSTKPFLLPGNSYYAGQKFTGFLARNIFVDTMPGALPGPLALDLSPYSSFGTFDIVAAKNFYFEGPVEFVGLPASAALDLIAGNQFVFTPGVSLTANVQDLLLSSAKALTLDKVTVNNFAGNIAMNIGSGVNLQNNSQINAAGVLSVNAVGNLSVNSSKFNGSTLIFSTPGNINIAGTSGTGTSLNTDPASGSVIIASGQGSINVGGTSITAHALTLNSGDGILLDGTGHTITGSGYGANASFTAPNQVTLNHADFTSLTVLNAAANTIVCSGDNFPSICNFGTKTGQVNVGGAETFGELNLYNCSWESTPITSASQVTLTTGPRGTPGIYSYALH